MKTSILCLAILFAAASEADAQTGCRRYTDWGALRGHQQVVYAQRGDHATIDFTKLDRSATVVIEGIVCDSSGRPVSGLGVMLVRYASKDAAKGKAPSATELQNRLDAYEVLARNERTSGSQGGFRFLGVNPGQFALQVDWDKLPETTEYVVFDVNWTASLSLRPGYDGG